MRNLPLYSVLVILMTLMGCEKDEFIYSKSITGNSFLSDEKYDKLIVEIQYISGYQPTDECVDSLKSFLEQRLNKPGGITIVQSAISSPGKSSYSMVDIMGIEMAHRTQFTKKKTLTAYFFFADADYAQNYGNSKVLGIAYGSSSMVIFEKTVKDFSGGIGQPPVSALESTVVNHEFGHILGLVNNGTSMQAEHQDEDHGSHCDDENCLMYYSAETTDIVANIIGGNIPQLDAKCIEDLRANGGK